MQDDIEFFTGENIELQSKFKEVCQHNAQLRMQIIELTQAKDNLELQLLPGARMSNPIMRDSLSATDNDFEDNHQLEEVLTERNDMENDEDGLENAMFEVA